MFAVAPEKPGAEIVFRENRIGRDSAGQAAFVKGHARQHTDVQFLTNRIQLLCGRLLEDVVNDLHRVNDARAQRLDDVGRLVIVDRDADIANFTFVAQRLQRFDPVGSFRPVVVPDVELLQINSFDAQIAQTLFRGFDDVIRRKHFFERNRLGRPL